MNAFVNGMTPITENGAKTLGTSGNELVNLFSMIGSARNRQGDVMALFDIALRADPEMAWRIALWTRDCRGGAGERAIFEKIVAKYAGHFSTSVLSNLMTKIVELGRYDDLFALIENPVTRKAACAFLKNESQRQEVSGLVGKWLPREKSANKNIAKIIMREWGMNSSEYRKYIVGLTNVVEQKMCAKQFDQIEYKHVPSLAMARYSSAFGRNDQARFAEYKAALASGELQAKATSLYPHDLVRSVRHDPFVANEQWKALKNYIPDGVKILPIVDVSGSMQCPASGSVSCMDVSVALGLYLAEKQSSAFKDMCVTFETHPQLFKIEGETLFDRVNNLYNAPWGGSTDFVAAMRLILDHAVRNQVSAEDMPDYLICCSDMQFNQADRSNNRTNFEYVKQMYEKAGYQLPKLIFWQLNGRAGDVQAKANTENVAMVSGFSPAIMEAVLGCDCPTPESIMAAAVCNPRYDVKGLTV